MAGRPWTLVTDAASLGSGVLDVFDDRFSRHVAGDDVRQGHRLEHFSLVGAQRDPDPLQRLGRSPVRHVRRPLTLRPLTAAVERLAVDGPDDLSERYLGGRGGEPEPAVRTPL